MVTRSLANPPLSAPPTFGKRLPDATVPPPKLAANRRDPKSLRRCYFAGWANEPIFASTDATTDLVGRYVEAGATDFTFYLHNPADPLLGDLAAAHRMATRDQIEEAALEVFPQFTN